jgi:hypothetical protein
MAGDAVGFDTANALSPLFGPQPQRLLTLIALELVGDPDQRAEVAARRHVIPATPPHH